MIGEGALTFREFAMRDPLPLAAVHDVVLEFLRDRHDAVLFGAEELRRRLDERLHIAVRVRTVREGLGYRLYQVRKEGNRHLADVRPARSRPPAERIERVLVMAPAELIASKVMASVARRGKPKSFTDLRDLAVLLLRFPELKTEGGPVRARLEAAGAAPDVLSAWDELVAQQIIEEDEDEEFG
jgi:hypothetical protein